MAIAIPQWVIKLGMVNTDYNTLLKSAKSIQDSINSITSTKTSISTKYKQLGLSWNDKKYRELGEIVDECTVALNSILKTLLQGEKFVVSLAKSIQEYESTNFQEGSSYLSGQMSVTSTPASSPAIDPVSAIKLEGKAWSEGLSNEEKSAIRDYTGTSYLNINAVLRGVENDFSQGNHERAVHIHQALQRSCIPYECTVYRGASLSALGDFQSLSDEQLVGNILIDRGFMSTSLNSGDAFGGDIRLEITVPQGAQGAYVGYLSQCGHYESEVLFDRRQRMEITNVYRDNFGNRTICARLLL